MSVLKRTVCFTFSACLNHLPLHKCGVLLKHIDGDLSSISSKPNTDDDIVGDSLQPNETSSHSGSYSTDAAAAASVECDDYVNFRHSYTVCGICCQRFSSYARLRTHLQKAHGVESPPGDAAETVGGRSSTAADDNGAGFMCAVCGRQFRLRQLLTTHSVTHTGERPYECRHPGCSKRFGQSSTRNYHERTHSDARPYVCAQCGLGFKLQPILRNHVASVHGDTGGGSTQPAHRCKECGKVFKLAGALQTHVRTTHRADRPHACPDCPKRFKSRQQVERHRVSMHSNERPLACPICGRSFAQLCNMRTHMRTHTGERPFACSVCGSTFSHSGTLKGHMASHRKDNESLQQLNGSEFDDMSLIAKMFD
jgi:KRAB domain-containing zinc finger protein